MSTRAMVSTAYRVEASGWDMDENFFVEKTELDWTEDEKTIHLQHPVRKGTVVFIRLMEMDVQENAIPVAYQAASVTYKMGEGFYDVCLVNMLPRMQAAVEAGRWRK